MFLPQLFLKARQKGRHYRLYRARALVSESIYGQQTCDTAIAGSPGLLAVRTVERLYIKARQCYTVRGARPVSWFWVNLQSAVPITRKPLNVRMGKGRGAYVEQRTRVLAGVTLVQAQQRRLGLFSVLCR